MSKPFTWFLFLMFVAPLVSAQFGNMFEHMFGGNTLNEDLAGGGKLNVYLVL